MSWWSRRTRRQKRLLFAGGLLLALPALGCVLGEVYVRVRHPAYADLWGAIRSHPVWVRELRPGAAGRMRALTGEYDHAYAVDERGLRVVPGEHAAGPRLLCVGDSNTFGLGVEDEEVWVTALGVLGQPLNAGWASGYAPDTATLFLEARLAELGADLVLQQLTPGNDLRDMGGKSVWTRDAEGRLASIEHDFAWVPDAVQAQALPRYLALQVLPALRRLCRSPPPEDESEEARRARRERLSAVEERGLERLREVLPRQRAFVRGQGAEHLVLLLPCASQHLDVSPGTRLHFAFVRAELARALAELEVEVLDPAASPEWLTASAGGAPLFYEDWHLTPAGNRALARYLVRVLGERLGDGE